jgi:hypothetical protein
MNNISKHVSWDEATKSNTAIRLGIDNTPSDAIVETMKTTAEKIFEPLREKLGPIRITSFFRCPDLNRAIGGSKTSQHCKGEAMDISGIKVTNAMLFDTACQLAEFDQIIWEFGNSTNPAWVHISYSSTHNRKQILVAKKQGTRTIYVPYRKP